MIVGLVTDSSCDLPERLLERFKIAVVPLTLQLGSETYLDGDLTNDQLWQMAAAGDSFAQTSQPSQGVFEATYERLVNQGKQVLCVMLTGRHTGTVETARIAARRFEGRVRVFDSRSLSLGLGFQVLEAAHGIELGQSMDELVALLQDVRTRIHTTVVLDTLENVRRGGRADAFIGMVGRMSQVLRIKPIVNFVDGRVQLTGVARSLRQGVNRILCVASELDPVARLGVIHARNGAVAESVADRLSDRLSFPRGEVIVRETGPVLASHAGAGAVGIFALTRRD